VIGRFAETDIAVMALCAVIDNAGVLKVRRGELSSVMADVTVLGCRQVVNEFPDADDVVMAGGTTISDAGMIKGTCGECTGCMTYGAIFGCRHMVNGLARRVDPIVTGLAECRGHHIRRVVDKCTDKARGAMAQATVCGGHGMICRHAGCRGSIMAGGAGLRYGIEGRMVENTAQVKCLDAMARHAIHVRLRMIRCLPGSINAVMTGDTAIRNVVVVDKRR
jgi:hypothetical protein